MHIFSRPVESKSKRLEKDHNLINSIGLCDSELEDAVSAASVMLSSY